MTELIFFNMGLVDYSVALDKQLELVEQVHLNPKKEYIILCKHPEVVTLGRSSKENDLFAWDGNVLEVSRGGRATYHGPSQIVIYPIVNLKNSHSLFGAQDVTGFLRTLENSLIDFLKLYEINAQGKSIQKNKTAEKEETGVWIGSKKIASLGIAVKKWVTYHGAAINIHNDPMAYRGMNPCGFSNQIMTSLESMVNHS
ncbi:MAG: lipoyl(octanoyl) transferase LipB, partial [Bdellovibrionaceae bacterium]|nr:lipoyl(octanoyl) transferase LipB [Pseudobdellovibrionaceae bacterium]